MRRFWLIPLITLLLSGSAFAQNPNQAQASEQMMVLTGAVYDINGSVIVTANAVAYSPDGRRYESATSDEGYYKFELPLAVYKIEVSAPGFCSARIERFKVVSATHGKMSLDFVLDVQGTPGGCRGGHEIEIKPNRKPEQGRKSKPVAK